MEASQIAKQIDYNQRFIMIPYNAVGTRHGMLKGFFADELIVDKVSVKNAVIAVYHGKLSVEGAYHMLLNPEILEGQGNVK